MTSLRTQYRTEASRRELEDAKALTSERMRLLVDVTFPTSVHNGVAVRGSTLKLVLFTIAAYEGERFSFRRIADRAGIHKRTTELAIGVLRREGYLSSTACRQSPDQANSYTVAWDKIARERKFVPLCLQSCRPATATDTRNTNRRAKNRARAVARAALRQFGGAA